MDHIKNIINTLNLSFGQLKTDSVLLASILLGYALTVATTSLWFRASQVELRMENNKLRGMLGKQLTDKPDLTGDFDSPATTAAHARSRARLSGITLKRNPIKYQAGDTVAWSVTPASAADTRKRLHHPTVLTQEDADFFNRDKSNEEPDAAVIDELLDTCDEMKDALEHKDEVVEHYKRVVLWKDLANRQLAEENRKLKGKLERMKEKEILSDIMTPKTGDESSDDFVDEEGRPVNIN